MKGDEKIARAIAQLIERTDPLSVRCFRCGSRGASENRPGEPCKSRREGWVGFHAPRLQAAKEKARKEIYMEEIERRAASHG